MYFAFTLEVPRRFPLIRPCLIPLTLGPLGPYLKTRIYTLPRGSARYIFKTLNTRPAARRFPMDCWALPDQKPSHSRTESPFWPGIVATPTRNSRSGLESSTVPHRIAVVPWDRRQSHTESPFWPGIGDSPTRNRRSGLGSATVPHGTAALAWDRFQSRTECLLWPRGGAQNSDAEYPGGSLGCAWRLPRAISYSVLDGRAKQGGEFGRLLNPKGVRAGWAVGSDAR